MTLALTNCDIFTGDDVLYEHAVLIEDHLISSVVALDAIPTTAEVKDLRGASVAPGFIDLQVNGGGDVLLTAVPTAPSIERVVAAHRRFGTTGMLPTFITADPEVFLRAREAVDDCLERGVPGVLGVHFEGPFLNPAKAGVHDASLMRDPHEADFRWLRSSHTAPTVLTVAPEMLPEGWLARCASDENIILSAGHTEATYDQLTDALASGLAKVTHLFNAMSPFTSREPGTTGTALLDRHSFCGIIVDGHHSHFASVRVAWQAKELGRMLLVTDAMPPVGGIEDRFEIGRHRIKVDHGRCTSEDGVLAGSTLDMATAVRNVVQQVGIPKDEALRMASLYPAVCLGLDHRLGRVRPGYSADLAIFDNELYVSAVVQNGRFFDERSLSEDFGWPPLETTL